MASGGDRKGRSGVWKALPFLALGIVLVSIGSVSKTRASLARKKYVVGDVSGWLEDSQHGNQTKVKLLQNTPVVCEVALHVRPHSDGYDMTKSGSPPPHLHLRQTEWLTVTEGRLTLLLDGVERNVTAADGPQEIPPLLRHTWWNAESEHHMEAVATFRPALHSWDFFRSVYAYGATYGTFSKVPIPQFLVLFEAFEMPHGDIPDLVWSTVIRHVAVPFFKFAGYRGFVDEYMNSSPKLPVGPEAAARTELR